MAIRRGEEVASFRNISSFLVSEEGERGEEGGGEGGGGERWERGERWEGGEGKGMQVCLHKSLGAMGLCSSSFLATCW